MEANDLLKSKPFKFFLGVAIVFGILIIARAGYDFGQWLQRILN